MKVRVYRNLHRKCYSVLSYIKGKGWRLSHHTSAIQLIDAKFVVSDAGRERARNEMRRNVHAFIEGYTGCLPSHVPELRKVTYNPFEMESFEADTGRDWEPIFKSKYVQLDTQGAHAL